ncbi:MAG TPA: sigma 54-interacting transcriptional regulator [Bryobacteraceae bacterium]|nr:sigma 54-interacting transcriptional regulator [Bryobacteraceae bacterium]
MIRTVSASQSSINEAILELARSIAGHNDLQSLLSGVATSLRKVVNFEYLALTLHQPQGNRMQSYVLSSTSGSVKTHAMATLPVAEDPSGEVWSTQQPLVIPSLAKESRWPQLVKIMLGAGVRSIALIPLTAGENRLGTLGFGCLTPFEPSPAELEFLERVASEFAVAVDAHLAKQAAIRERDRLRVLFDITNALVSKLSIDELFPAISEQLSRVVKYDVAALLLKNEATGRLDVYALHFTGPNLFQPDPDGEASIDPEGRPSAEAIATGRPVVVSMDDLVRYPAVDRKRVEAAGARSGCSIPLLTPNRTLGTLELARTSDEPWTEDDVDFLVQVARQIAIAVENSLAYRELAEIKERLATEKLYLEDEIRFDQNIGNMVGEGPAFQAMLKSIQIVAPTDATVLILGETGTGKELVARAIHELSPRKNGSFVKVNCAAIPASLLESELFGHEKGAFTGALNQKIGRFELAHKGTLFLDEIGEMPLELQPKLLRAIQDQEFERVGGTRTIRTDVRFIVATNRDLKAMVEENRFRADLYYRLHVFPLTVPPLRERREDIPLLTRYFVQKYAQRMNRKIDTIPAAALEALSRYDWPGNIRELQNVIERSVILTSGNVLKVAMPEIMGKAGSLAPASRPLAPDQAAEREKILRVLKETKGVVGGPNGAAARLGLKRTTLQSRMRKYQITRQYH